MEWPLQEVNRAEEGMGAVKKVCEAQTTGICIQDMLVYTWNCVVYRRGKDS